MTDVVDQAIRSRMMASIGATDTAPEMAVRRYLHGAGLRFRVHDRHLPGRPDIVLARHRTVIFVHGCFWHRHPRCRFATTPASNASFWQRKFSENVARDKRVARILREAGWCVEVIWECSSRDELKLDALAWRIRANCC